MNELELKGRWFIKAPKEAVYNIITDFENYPKNFPKVTKNVQILKRNKNILEMNVQVQSFGKVFPVQMKTTLLPNKGFISENNSSKFGTSGHEELLLQKSNTGTTIHYNYHISIHKLWLRVIGHPLISLYSMKYWEKAVIQVLKDKLEK